MTIFNYKLCDEGIVTHDRPKTETEMDFIATTNSVGVVDNTHKALRHILPTTYSDTAKSVKSMGVAKNFLLCLDANGSLHVICSLTMLAIRIWNEVTI